jgi:hypothetical protein
MLAPSSAWSQNKTVKNDTGQKAFWQEDFAIAKCAWSPTGRNEYFILEPGYQLVLESKAVRLAITVLDDTRMVDGVLTRVVEEREWKDGELYEVARNFFAICGQTKDVFYFGEEVDFYEKGKVVRHDGSWVAGKNGAKAGLMMSGAPKVGMKYYQEIAPGVAMDRAEIVRLQGNCDTPAGKFSKCMRVKETTALDLASEEIKSYAPGIGFIQDGEMRLTKYGFVEKK